MSTSKIAIIGAGPAGLTLARLLHVLQVKASITVFERDTSPTAREEQGGTLDLHEDTGLAAIRKCDLWEEFLKFARYEGEEMIMRDKWDTEIIHLKGGNNRPEIDRYRLREILLASVPASCIQWDSKLKEVTEDGRLRFDGRDDLVGPFDLIVGADGAWSKVRDRLTGIKPAYAGVSGYELEISKPAMTCPHIDKWAGQGGMISLAHKRLLNCQRVGSGALKVRSWFTCPEGEAAATLEKLDKQGTFDKTLKIYQDQGWTPPMLELLKQTDVSTIRVWTLYELPVGHRWEHKPGFTLIGDASSLATPFSGEGVNKAMKDALELADSLMESEKSTSRTTLDQAVSNFERKLHPRSEKLQRVTMRNKQAMFSAESPVELLPIMLQTMLSESPSAVMRMCGTRLVANMLWAVLWVKQRAQWAVKACSVGSS